MINLVLAYASHRTSRSDDSSDEDYMYVEKSDGSDHSSRSVKSTRIEWNRITRSRHPNYSSNMSSVTVRHVDSSNNLIIHLSSQVIQLLTRERSESSVTFNYYYTVWRWNEPSPRWCIRKNWSKIYKNYGKTLNNRLCNQFGNSYWSY